MSALTQKAIDQLEGLIGRAQQNPGKPQEGASLLELRTAEEGELGVGGGVSFALPRCLNESQNPADRTLEQGKVGTGRVSRHKVQACEVRGGGLCAQSMPALFESVHSTVSIA